MMTKTQYEALGIRIQLRELVRYQMLVKKHFLYIDSINDAKGNKQLQERLRLMLVQIEKLKKNIENFKRNLK